MVQGAETSSREQIKASLLAEADRLLSLWDTTAEVISDEPEIGHYARRVIEEDNIPCMLIKWHCEGLTAETWARWQEDPTVIAAAINDKLTRVELPDVDGLKVRLLKMKMPMIISNRATLTTFYRHTREDGTEVLLHSSQGNEALIEQNSSEIGWDVVTNNVITYMAWKPFDGGFDITHISKLDPNGMIPDFIKKKGAERMANNVKLIVDYL